LVPVQRTVNALNAVVAPDAPRNDAYTGKNLVLIVVGVIFYVLLILGMMAPVQNDTFTTWVVA
jgi:lipopolysaccharide export LptBFGC system permease protein LptF